MNTYQNEEELVERYRGFVTQISKKYRNAGKTVGLEVEDLISIGLMGLIKACRRFDESKGHEFIHYAGRCIRGEILRGIRDCNPGANYGRTAKELGMTISKHELYFMKPQEIAEKLNTSIDNVMMALNYLDHSAPMTLDMPIRQTENEVITLLDVLGAEDDFTAEEAREYLKSLNERDRTIVDLLLKDVSQRKIGEVIGCSQMHVSRLITKIRKNAVSYYQVKEVVS